MRVLEAGYRSEAAAPHLLPPNAYHSAEQHRIELDLLRRSWHLVCARSELTKPGQFVTLELCGVAIQVRNFNNELVALSNVCAHRHCLLSDRAQGQSASMRCPYHGWEYGADGRTRKIPSPENFIGMERDTARLPRYRLATLGRLVFVCLSDDAPSLEEQFGDRFEAFANRFGDDRALALSWNHREKVNWKVPIENSLESYHIPAVHPRTFGEDPGKTKSHHRLDSTGTSFSTPHFLSVSRRDQLLHSIDSLLLRGLGMAKMNEYRHEHVFPNLLFSFTGTISLAMCWTPISPTSCQVVVRQLSPRGRGPLSRLLRPLSWSWGHFGARATRQILNEDFELFPSIQRGLEASPHRGVLGICEERISALHRHIVDGTQQRAAPMRRHQKLLQP
jgi:phenylpropionate dioxygenase-like ring-hydroxylating dioxygenase large terminal subunit